MGPVAIKITRERANEILKEHADKPYQKVVICAPNHQWFDVRGLNDSEIIQFAAQLLKTL